MGKKDKKVVQFSWVGQLLDFVIEGAYKIKYLRVVVSDREYWIKLPKELRSSLDPQIVPGSWIEIEGSKEVCKKTGKVKLKAEFVQRATTPGEPGKPVAVPSRSQSKPAKASILVCQKSDCVKRGGRQVCQAIEQELRDRGLEDRVKIKKTGCLKKCKKAPNLVVMPDKTSYSRVSPQEIPQLIEQHYTTSQETGKQDDPNEREMPKMIEMQQRELSYSSGSEQNGRSGK
ncbi:MAG: (2Fe-2S) ferredoxin domain-containing protein [Cyanobacteriota bacterium]|nr:(2Fe-2S) ferredoxin domain-containing protein [Cyanobacteriota bacterium]